MAFVNHQKNPNDDVSGSVTSDDHKFKLLSIHLGAKVVAVAQTE
jgi:hypothetical protein